LWGECYDQRSDGRRFAPFLSGLRDREPSRCAVLPVVRRRHRARSDPADFRSFARAASGSNAARTSVSVSAASPNFFDTGGASPSAYASAIVRGFRPPAAA